MKKTKFSIDLHQVGDLNDGIVRMVTNHNAGDIELSFDTIRAYGRSRYAMWPTVTPEFTFKESVGGDNPNTMEIWENGKLTVTLQIKEIFELVESNPDDLKDVL